MLEPLAGVWAIRLTAVIFPVTVFPAGISIDTRSPTLASLCLLAPRLTATTRRVEVVCKTGEELLPPLGDFDAEGLDADGLDAEGLPFFGAAP